jgi:cell wall-associated NlpC family hydrolase
MLKSRRESVAHVRRFLCAAALALLGTGAAAAPDLTVDALGRYLADNGLVSASASIDAKASDMVLTAMNFLGVRYRRGGTSVDHGFDCSGFTRHVVEMSLGLVLPRRVDEQATAAGLITIKRDELKPGDLVFFNTLKRTFSHVGIYVGDGKFIHSPRPGGEVRVEDMRFVYWAKRFTGARRAESARDASEPAPLAAVSAGPVREIH